MNLKTFFSTYFLKKSKNNLSLNEEPLRAELLSTEQLKQFAQSLADTDKIGKKKDKNLLLSRLKENTILLRNTYHSLVEADLKGRRLSSAAEWLIDNFYLVEQQIQLIKLHLPKKYSSDLPQLAHGPLKGFPRIYGMAFALIAHLDAQLDDENIEAFVESYQKVEVLELGELWAFPIMLRLALIENLRRVSERLAFRRSEKDDGFVWAQKILGIVENNPKKLLYTLADFADSHTALSAPFLEEFSDHLQIQDSKTQLFINWLEQNLSEEGTSLSQKLQKDSHIQASEQITIANSISCLRFLSATNWKDFVEKVSPVEHVLEKDPSAAYAMQEFFTRDYYRHRVEKLSKKYKKTELEVAQKALEAALHADPQSSDFHKKNHIGYYLVGKGKYNFEKGLAPSFRFGRIFVRCIKKIRLFLYLLLITLITASLALFIPRLSGFSYTSWQFLLLYALSLLPASNLALSLVHFFATLCIKPKSLPSLDFSQGIPHSARSLVVIPCLFTNTKTIHELLSKLEIHYLGNRDPQLDFVLLSDFTDASVEEKTEDAPLLLEAEKGIIALNKKYAKNDSPIFHVFHRKRVWNNYEKIWMGWERKRGKLEQLNAFLRNEKPKNEETEAFPWIFGGLENKENIQYIITLDADSDLPRNTAAKLIAAMAHPLNTPVYSEKKDRIIDGYGILQPRMTIRLQSAKKSIFSRLSSGLTGIDPYSREVSDVYQDLFGEGSFVGKGIYHIDTFRRVLENRFPENTILSHDLIEGAYARSGLLSTVELYEDMPHSYLGDMSRHHRWMRGDWQIFKWIGFRTGALKGRRKGLNILNRWKIFDNIRRALVAPVFLALILLSWFMLPSSALILLLFLFIVLGFSDLARSLTSVLQKPDEQSLRLHLQSLFPIFKRQLVLFFLELAFLPFQAFISIKAFASSALRMLCTRRGLMRWYLPMYRRLNKRKRLAGFILEFWVSPVLAVLSCFLLLYSKTLLFYALPIQVLWFFSPLCAFLISRERKVKKQSLKAIDIQFLRKIALRTWRFFNDFITVHDNFLAPDNFQEIPEPVIASRTSPTNIGLSLLSMIGARDFGYISLENLVQKLTESFDTLSSLEQYRGHFYNWYDTKSLAILPPHYISSVDSGNLFASFISLKKALVEVKKMPYISSEIPYAIKDALAILVEESKKTQSVVYKKILKLQETFTIDLLQNANTTSRELKRFLEEAKELNILASHDEGLQSWFTFFIRLCNDHLESVKRVQTQADFHTVSISDILGRDMDDDLVLHFTSLIKKIDMLEQQCLDMIDRMDFSFLYNKKRDLLSIGYDVSSRRQDPACYDLLASESRIGSFALIAYEQLPLDHWFSLSRLLVGKGSESCLVSWSGSMFEYLMPSLFMRDYEDTLLSQTSKHAIQRQISYARQRRIPWGMSESAYNLRDSQHVYQYRAFGVPGLGLKRGLSDDMVVAPYATVLALLHTPQEAIENLKRLVHDEKALGNYGLYEAIDYTPSRIPRGKTQALVQTFMAHHQGMSFLALTEILYSSPMVQRFMSDPAIKATEVLLQERIPEASPAIQVHVHEAYSGLEKTETDAGASMRIFKDPHLHVPEVHLLSNAHYTVMVTQSGGNFSRWKNKMLTRWREDATQDSWGQFSYFREISSNTQWSGTHQPLCNRDEIQEAIFTQGRAEYRKRNKLFETYNEICVSPEDDVEIRKFKLTNLSKKDSTVEFTSYAELVLAPIEADLAHRVFSTVFIKTEIIKEMGLILSTRKIRDEHEEPIWYFQMLVSSENIPALSFETDRARFIGRNRTSKNPHALDQKPQSSLALSNTDGFVLDPIHAIRGEFFVPVDRAIEFHIVNGVASTREEALSLAQKYRDRHFIDRAFDMAWSHSQIILRLLNITEADAQLYGRLASSLLYATARNRALPKIIASNTYSQPSLWRFGISGDIPIVLFRISDNSRINLIVESLQAHAYWRLKGLESDLVIINEDFSGYRASLNDKILSAIQASPNAHLIDKRGGIFLRRIDMLSEEDTLLLQSVARIVLSDTAESLKEQIERRFVPRKLPPALKPAYIERPDREYRLSNYTLSFDNGLGGFTQDGREYIIRLKAGEHTPLPWSNVIASPHIGTVVSERGAMYTWVENAHEYRLTPWYNDPISDTSGEAYFIRDEGSGRFWSPFFSEREDSSGHVCRHGLGYSVFEKIEAGIFTKSWIYTAMDSSVKFVKIKLKNICGQRRRLSLFAFNELVLGEWRHSNLMHITTSVDSLSGALIASNPYNRVFSKRLFFAFSSHPSVIYSGDRTECIGIHGSLDKPAALFRETLSGRLGSAMDPIAAMQNFIQLERDEEIEIVYGIGAADSLDEIRNLIKQYSGIHGAQTALEGVWDYWSKTVSKIQVSAPSCPELEVMTNGWLMYQSIACRMWARSAYYQSGGAYGFRDQLQDTMGMALIDSNLLRSQILLNASRQFVEGDVQHWWHPPLGAGVRTKFSDDLLWLPQAIYRYIQVSSDLSILDEEIPFLQGRLLHEDEESHYEQHSHGPETASLYEHGLRSIKKSLAFGVHGLPLMGCGDWNDGMNKVGIGGKGESVWLGWFLYDTLISYAEIAKLKNDSVHEDMFFHEANELMQRIENTAWDGKWYRRAYFDDGSPLGSNENDECKIDSLSQSWAVISAAGNKGRAKEAMKEVKNRLVKMEDKMILLFEPPFEKTHLDPGYIKSYPPGIRENGGQYTHGVIWSAIAFALLGDHETAWDLFSILNPVRHGDSPEAVELYKVEPYVMTADIYGAKPYIGRGGWSWYTGASAWMYRFIVEYLLGLEKRGDTLFIHPRLSKKHLKEFSIKYKHKTHCYEIHVKEAQKNEKSKMYIDGIEVFDRRIPLLDDEKDHLVELFIE